VSLANPRKHKCYHQWELVVIYYGTRYSSRIIRIAKAGRRDIHDLPDLDKPPVRAQQLDKVHLIVERDVVVRDIAEEVPRVGKLHVRPGNVLLSRRPVSPLPLVPQPVHVGVVQVEERVSRRAVRVPNVARVAAYARVAPAMVRHVPDTDAVTLRANVEDGKVGRREDPVDQAGVERPGC